MHFLPAQTLLNAFCNMTHYKKHVVKLQRFSGAPKV